MKKTILNKKIAFLTLGCKVNMYETEAMKNALMEEGAIIVDEFDTADIGIINTCSVTNIADRKSRQMIHRAKKNNPELFIVATGCYVQTGRDTSELLEQGVDMLIGNEEKHNVVSILDKYFCENPGNESHNNEEGGDYSNVLLSDISKSRAYEEYEDSETQHSYDGENVRAYLKIQDGCNQFCSYCIIPYARGRVRSRELENVVQEAKRMAKAGKKEIVLTGIHISSYQTDGLECGESLVKLLTALNDIEGIERIRVGSLEPRIITEDFVKQIVALEKFCPHFHLSLQSGSDTVLKRMNRKYTTDEYYESVCILRKYYEKPSITTDMITGFPGETEEEHAESVRFAEKVAFSKIHVFPYSKREGTRAASMSGQLTEAVKKERAGKLIEVSETTGKSYSESFIGSEQTVLLEEDAVIDGENYMVGHTERYLRVYVKKTDELSENMLVKVKIQSVFGEENCCMAIYRD